MENAYGIGVTNRYQLFLDTEDDPLEELKRQEQEKEAKKKTKLSEKENKGKPEVKGKLPPVQRKTIKETQNLKSPDVVKNKEDFNKNKPRPTGDRPSKFNNENREERNNRKNREEKTGDYQRPVFREDRGGENRFERRDREFRTDNKEFRGDGGGEGRGRGGRGGRGGMNRGGRGGDRGERGGERGERGPPRSGRGGYDGRGKREFDRQSGSDKTEVSHHQTQNNADESGEWSNEKPDDYSAETGDNKESSDTPRGENDDTAHIEEEQREMTLDEYKALKGNRQKPIYNLRKAGEGEDPTQWKKMYTLTKKKEGEEEEEEEEYDSSDYPQRAGRQKQVLDIAYVFKDRPGRGGGGGRGRGGRGMRGGGGAPHSVPPATNADGVSRPPGGGQMRDRDGSRNSRQIAPKVDDEKDFPQLG
ncbi:plasminogen activator inhibitor 1 RNA-binding protein isoform X2 [Nilaparvata lugens]|uniref:plasminogen activator inhibitor 1 RNA-binding protein isoform X2 n=1 Tax=Nilaparvata lugens TaxID=108931 RepID=UPI00193CE9BF|nr:plasminogen activator inhibitor 1 RNA-binding protein isoform X2 [Nilaparvata lugens]